MGLFGDHGANYGLRLRVSGLGFMWVLGINAYGTMV